MKHCFIQIGVMLLLSACFSAENESKKISTQSDIAPSAAAPTPIKTTEDEAEGAVSQLYEMIEEDSEAIAASFIRLSEANRLNDLSVLDAWRKLFDQKMSMENRFFLGTLCGFEGQEVTCDEVILLALESDQADPILTALRESIIGEGIEAVSGPDVSIEVEHLGYNYKLPIPDGFCDATGSEISNHLIDMLDQRRLVMSILPIHYFVFSECKPFFGAIGYVALSNTQNSTITSQLEFNKKARSFLESSIFKRLDQTIGDLESALAGIDLAEYSREKPAILIDDSDAIVTLRVASVNESGQLYNEYTFSSTTVLPMTKVNYYITVVVPAGETDIGTAKWMRVLSENASNLKGLN